MQTFNGVELYETIDEMPIIRKHLFDKFLIMDSGMGSNMQDVEHRLQKLGVFLTEKDFDKALQETKNLHHTIFNGMAEINFQSLAFSSLVYKIDNKEVSVETESDAEKVLEQLQKKIKHKDVADFVEDVKKKLLTSLGYTFQSDI